VNAHDLLPFLDGARPVRGGWLARCPAHDDRAPSLSVAERNGRVLLHCHAGCEVRSIADAMGLELSDLFTDPPSGNGQKAGKKSRQPTDARRVVTEYVYAGSDGHPIAKKSASNLKGSPGSVSKAGNGSMVWAASRRVCTAGTKSAASRLWP
jgi:hypothetical protein